MISLLGKYRDINSFNSETNAFDLSKVLNEPIIQSLWSKPIFEIKVNNNQIDDIKIINSGDMFTNVPNIYINSENGNGAILKANLSLKKIIVLQGGNYKVIPSYIVYEKSDDTNQNNNIVSVVLDIKLNNNHISNIEKT